MLRRRTTHRTGRSKSRKVHVERLEPRRLFAADSIGVTPLDTGEFLLGTVAVTPVLFESNGQRDPQTQNWSAAEIDQVLSTVREGVNWWRDTLQSLDTVHELEFVIDDSFAIAPVATPYEPIDRPSTDFNLYVGDFITSQGHGDVNSIEEGVQRFNRDQRLKLGTDWAFTIFIVDASNDPDGLFAAGNDFAAAFAFAGGLFIVTPSTRPASTVAHEMGHIFWAHDEYSGGGTWTDRRGYYNTQNLNAADNPTPGFKQQISIMRGGVPLTAAYDQNVSPATTLAMVGWQDSDGDGVFDLADVPLRLEGTGFFDALTSTYIFQAEASAVPLLNRNSSGTRSDITLNRISQLQYRLDEGPWQVAAAPDRQHASFDLALPIASSFTSIQWRVIDLSTGVTSPILEGSDVLPALSAASISGFAWLDQNGNGVREADERLLENTSVVVSNEDGSPLLQGSIAAADFPDGVIPGNLDSVVLTADGLLHGTNVGSFASLHANNGRVFHAYDQQRNKWVDRWSSKVAFQASFVESVGEVELDAIGVGEASYARVEAYDLSGNLVARTTTERLAAGQRTTVRVTDSLGRIASIRAFGHAGSSIALDQLRFGSSGQSVTDATGSWRIANLPDGVYRIEFQPERVIHQVREASGLIQVIGGSSELVLAAADRVDSFLHNGSLAEDVNGDGRVSAVDALAVINDLGRFQPRVLGWQDPSSFDVDVNNDGSVSALDALVVINYVSRTDGGSSESWLSDPPPAENPTDSTVQVRTEPSRTLDSPLTSFELTPMFNSAGGRPEGESIEQGSADSRERPERGRQHSSTGVWAFPEMPLKTRTDRELGGEIDSDHGTRPSGLPTLAESLRIFGTFGELIDQRVKVRSTDQSTMLIKHEV
jgi:hypothetical protein